MDAVGEVFFQEQLDADVEKNCFNIGELEEEYALKILTVFANFSSPSRKQIHNGCSSVTF